jgi:hypothetical protein
MAQLDATDAADFDRPGDVFVKHRWIRYELVEWAQEANTIMLEYGVVLGARVYPDTQRGRFQARYQARKLIRLMDELDIHPRWQLQEHTEKRHGGWIWAVEYLPGGKR